VVLATDKEVAPEKELRFFVVVYEQSLKDHQLVMVESPEMERKPFPAALVANPTVSVISE
jgi:hypothetical protein